LLEGSSERHTAEEIAGAFSGYRFDFRGSSFSRIVGASLGPRTKMAAAPPVLRVDDRSLTIDMGDRSVAAGERISVILELQ